METKDKNQGANSIDGAITDAEHDGPDVKVFTDGSGMDGKISAAAILYRNRRMKTKFCYRLCSQ
jgi:hypothetical protein